MKCWGFAPRPPAASSVWEGAGADYDESSIPTELLRLQCRNPAQFCQSRCCWNQYRCPLLLRIGRSGHTKGTHLDVCLSYSRIQKRTSIAIRVFQAGRQVLCVCFPDHASLLQPRGTHPVSRSTLHGRNGQAEGESSSGEYLQRYGTCSPKGGTRNSSFQQDFQQCPRVTQSTS